MIVKQNGCANAGHVLSLGVPLGPAASPGETTSPQRGGAATKGARVCDPQELCRPPSVFTDPTRRPIPTCCGSQSSCVRQKICFERSTAFSLPLLLKKGGEGRGEEASFINFPSLRLSPRSFLAGRERQNAAGILSAEHNCSQSPRSAKSSRPATIWTDTDTGCARRVRGRVPQPIARRRCRSGAPSGRNHP